ncbi:hypothetical protein Tco_0801769 [Tanacetum coccineum]|uniref:Uncharacterized protein n=1 Tax=Tanacetum coccineum TaxID=301880 RepID=A0ABQ4ZZM1_9ASTR
MHGGLVQMKFRRALSSLMISEGLNPPSNQASLSEGYGINNFKLRSAPEQLGLLRVILRQWGKSDGEMVSSGAPVVKHDNNCSMTYDGTVSRPINGLDLTL